MTEARWSVVVISLLIWGGITLIFGRLIRDYWLAAGAGGAGALVFAVASFLLASDGDKQLKSPSKGASEE